MKVLKLSVDYDGYYGGYVHSHMLLPVEIKDSYLSSEILTLGIHSDKVSLGEIEGKHSDVYGDLNVKCIELNDLTYFELKTIIDDSDMEHFESFIENAEDDFHSELEDSELNVSNNREKLNELLDDYEAEPYDWEGVVAIHSKFKKYLKNTYETNEKMATIHILNKDLEIALDVLKNNGISATK